MSANRLRMICSKMFSKKIHFREQLSHFQFSVFDPFLGLKKYTQLGVYPYKPITGQLGVPLTPLSGQLGVPLPCTLTQVSWVYPYHPSEKNLILCLTVLG